MANRPPTWEDLSGRARTAWPEVTALVASLSLVDGERISTHRVSYARSGGAAPSWRVDDERGLLVLSAGGRLYRRATRRGPRVEASDDWLPGPELGYLGWGHPQLFLDPPHVPDEAAAVPGEVAGRPVWSVRLTSPHPLEVAFDTAAALPLRVAAVGAPYVTEVTALELLPELDPAVFAFPATAPAPRRSRPDGAFAAAALTSRGLRLPAVIPGLGDVADWSIIDADEETESFVAVGHSSEQGLVALARTALSHPPSRPLAAASGVSIGARAPRHVYAWHDATWSYELLTDATLDQDLLTLLEL